MLKKCPNKKQTNNKCSKYMSFSNHEAFFFFLFGVGVHEFSAYKQNNENDFSLGIANCILNVVKQEK